MPANRPHIDRDVKRDEILDVADTLLLRDGYDTTTMASIARQTGVANNAVYWYFPSKDDLLAAVLKRRLERAQAAATVTRSHNLQHQLRLLLAQLDEVANLTATVHARARANAAVAEVHGAFHAALSAFLVAGLRDEGLDGDDATRASDAITAMIEGIHLHEPGRDAAARDELVLWTLEHLTIAAQSGEVHKPRGAGRPRMRQPSPS